MAQRSTRNKIQWQADKIQNQLDRVLVHLKTIDELAEGRSEPIKAWMPALVQATDQLKEFFGRFQKDL